MTSASRTRLRLEVKTLGFLCLLFTASGWALNFTLMKILLREWPPLFSRGLAGLGAAGLLAIVGRLLGQTLKVPRAVIPRLIFAAFTNVFAFMGFSTLSLRWLPVGESLLLIYTMPIWSTLLAWPILGAAPSRRGVLALSLGTIGILVLMSGGALTLGTGQAWGIAFALGAAVLFALGGVLNGEALPIPAVVATMWQVAIGCAPMAILSLLLEHPRIGALTPAGAEVMLYMTIVAMGACYLTWFATLRYLPAPTAATGMLLVPFIGAVSASVLLHETFGPRQLSALAITLAGVAIALTEESALGR